MSIDPATMKMGRLDETGDRTSQDSKQIEKEKPMAWRPSDWVLEGELDNTILGWTTGWLKIEGVE